MRLAVLLQGCGLEIRNENGTDVYDLEINNFCSALCRMAPGCVVRRVDGYLRLEKEDR
jgi:hypothetical protein